MAAPSVSFTFANSTTADATQVNQNFTDLINGASDGTKDYAVKTLSATGNGSGSTVTVTDSGSGTAALEVNSTTKGALLPRLTYAQRNLIATPVEGLEIYNTTSKCKQIYTGSEWINIGVQAGDVVPSAKTTAGAGFLACDGSAVSRTTYAELFAAIGETHGQGDNSTTFNLPDYRGRFLRGVDSAQGRDPNAATRTAMATGGNTGDDVGSLQDDAFESHDHGGASFASSSHTHVLPFGSDGSNNFYTSNNGNNWDFGGSNRTGTYLTARGSASAGSPGSIVAPSSQTPSATSSISSDGGSETRPVNANVNFFIKF